MTEPKQGEDLTLPTSSNGESDPVFIEDEPLKKQENEEDVSELKEKLAKKEKEAFDFKQAFFKEREKNRMNRMADLTPPQPAEPSDYYDHYDDEEEKRIRSIIDKRLEEKKREDIKNNLQRALAKFIRDFPEYSPENDINDYNYNRLKSVTDRMMLGETIEEIYDSLVFAHNGLSKPISPESQRKVGDSGIGDTTTLPVGKENKPSALTRPLNKYEQEAAKRFPGGEVAYRKKLAEKEK